MGFLRKKDAAFSNQGERVTGARHRAQERRFEEKAADCGEEPVCQCAAV